MKILYTQQAIHDLQRLRDFIAFDNTKAAFNASERLRHAIKQLIDFPTLGKLIKNESKSLSVRDLFTGKYLIRYALLANEIHILRIWHTREHR